MNKVLYSVIWAAVLITSCSGGPGRQVLDLYDSIEPIETPEPYTITDYKNKVSGGTIPEWVSLFYDSGIRGVETLDAYRDRFVFISRNEGSNFKALNLWVEGFSVEQDFPRLASARIGTRFSSSVPHPDIEYGSFFITLVRSASDTIWNGAAKTDDFWILRKFPPKPEEDGEDGYLSPDTGDWPDTPAENRETERWEFLILVIMEKTLFASQLEGIYRNMNSLPPPTRDQVTAANRVRDRFYEGF